MRYAVAHIGWHDHDLKMVEIEADNPVTAMVWGVWHLLDSHCGETTAWLDAMLEDIPSAEGWDARIEQLRQEFFDADMMAAVMPL